MVRTLPARPQTPAEEAANAWAMARAAVARVAALRETSMLFALLFSTWLLEEKFGLQRALGTAVVLLAVMALRLG